MVGSQVIGASTDTCDSNYINGSRFGSGSGGSLTSMSVFVRAVSPSPNDQFQMAVYSDAAGRPGNLIASTATGRLKPNAWNRLAISTRLAANTNYWLMYNANGVGCAMDDMTYSSGGMGGYSGPVSFGSWPATIKSASTGAWTFAIFGTYGSSGPAPSPSPSPSPTPTPPPSPSPSPSPPPAPGGAAGHVAGFWLYGANMPWLNWNSDFGGSGGGVHNNLVQVDSKLSAAHAAGMRAVRWWVFEGGAPQIARDASGTPTGLNPAVYTDLDAALTEGAKYGISYDFVLFGSTNDDAVTHRWWEDPAKRSALVRVLTPLFAHYANDPRIHTWEIINEPDWQIRNGQTSAGGATATVDALADAVHANSHALVTVGEAQLQDMATWSGHHIDYHSPHYYDPFGTGANDPFLNQAHSPDGKPVVIGEFPASPGMNPPAQQRWQALYDKGYAGGWAWSLSPEHTADKISTDMNAAAAFAAGKRDLGPQ